MTQTELSQNVPLSKRDQLHIEKIKQMLLEGKSQLDMSRELHLNRRTVYRKLRKWMLTRDFEEWVKEAWLDKYQKVDDVEAFRALTKIYCKLIGARIESKEELYEETRIVWEDRSQNVNDKVHAP